MRDQLADRGILGQRERLELSHSEAAYQNNMLALAVFRAGTALSVHLLPSSEALADMPRQ
jgi:hypothetical protein